MSRYLTATEKSHELEAWSRIQAECVGLSGPGMPDPEIMPWCEKINALDGICTLQSCAGHRGGERGLGGHLWLRLDRAKARIFQNRAFELTRHSGIERISLIYQPWGQEVVQIEFQGAPTGQLDASIRAILGFLESL